MRKISYAIIIACCLAGSAYADGINVSTLSNSLKKAYQSLGEMGLTIDRAGRKYIAGKYAVAVPRSAIIEEKGKSYVVVLDKENPEMSDRLEVALGSKSDKYVHTRNGVSSGDYLVVRKQPLVTKAPPASKPIPKAKPVTSPYPSQNPRVKAPEPPRYATSKNDTRSQVATRPYTPPPVDQRSYPDRTSPTWYQREREPVTIYRPSQSLQPIDLEYDYDSYDLYPQEKGCPVCDKPSYEEPYHFSQDYDDFDYSDGDYDFDYDQFDYDYGHHDYYPRAGRRGSGCFTEGLCRSFRKWFH